jgi:hypothetical protein
LDPGEESLLHGGIRTMYFPSKKQERHQHQWNARIRHLKMGYSRLITAFTTLFKKPCYFIAIKPTENTEGSNKLASADKFRIRWFLPFISQARK